MSIVTTAADVCCMPVVLEDELLLETKLAVQLLRQNTTLKIGKIPNHRIMSCILPWTFSLFVLYLTWNTFKKKNWLRNWMCDSFQAANYFIPLITQYVGPELWCNSKTLSLAFGTLQMRRCKINYSGCSVMHHLREQRQHTICFALTVADALRRVWCRQEGPHSPSPD